MAYQRTGRPTGRPPQTHCRNGHEYTPENTHYFNVTTKGRTVKQKRCKICLQTARDNQNAKKRKAIAAKKESWYF